MKCDRCPASWESGGMTRCGYECDSYGCMILGAEMLDDNCKLSKEEIEKRLRQLKDYEAGKIERPQWVANRFMREMDNNWGTGHRLGIFLPGFPPLKMMNGCYEHIESAIGVRDNYDMGHRKGYEDAKRDFCQDCGAVMDLENSNGK